MSQPASRSSAGWRSLAVCLGLGYLPAFTGLLAGPGPWYASLNKPTWNPPAWVFGPVWTLLYLMIGVALWLLWRAAGRRWAGAPLALSCFAAQWLLNALWTPCFFGLQSPALALGVILLLNLAILATMLSAWRQRRAVTWLLLPYWLWVSFATCLNFTLWQLNP